MAICEFTGRKCKLQYLKDLIESKKLEAVRLRNVATEAPTRLGFRYFAKAYDAKVEKALKLQRSLNEQACSVCENKTI